MADTMIIPDTIPPDNIAHDAVTPTTVNVVDVDELLICLVKENPHLYDSSRRDYRDAGKRDNTWKSIGRVLGIPGADAMKSWRNLRDRYNKERKVIAERQNRGDMGDLTSRWRFFNYLGFLSDFVRPRSQKTFPPQAMNPQAPVLSPQSPPYPSSSTQDCHHIIKVDPEYCDDGSRMLEDVDGHDGHLDNRSNRSTPSPSPAYLSPTVLDPGCADEMPRRTNKRSGDQQVEISKIMKKVTAAVELAATRAIINADSSPLSAQAACVSCSVDPDVAFGVTIIGRLKKFDSRQKAEAQARILQMLLEIEFPKQYNQV